MKKYLFLLVAVVSLALSPGQAYAQRYLPKMMGVEIRGGFAQAIFTAYELKHLGLDKSFDGIYLSSDYRCRKPDIRFFTALLEEQKLDIKNCLMIGNDLQTDIAGAKNAGLDPLYMHTNLTPPDQREADPHDPHEYEGWDWEELVEIIERL